MKNVDWPLQGPVHYDGLGRLSFLFFWGGLWWRHGAKSSPQKLFCSLTRDIISVGEPILSLSLITDNWVNPQKILGSGIPDLLSSSIYFLVILWVPKRLRNQLKCRIWMFPPKSNFMMILGGKIQFIYFLVPKWDFWLIFQHSGLGQEIKSYFIALPPKDM